KLGKGLGLAFGSRQNFVDVFFLDAVGQQGPFEIDLGALAQSPLAGEFFKVEQIFDGGGLFVAYGFVVVGIHRAPDDFAHAAFVFKGRRDEVLFGRRAVGAGQKNVARNDFEQTFGAGALEVYGFNVDDVPLDLARLDLSLDFGHPAGVVLEQDLGAFLGHVGVDLVYFLRRAVSAAK